MAVADGVRASGFVYVLMPEDIGGEVNVFVDEESAQAYAALLDINPALIHEEPLLDRSHVEQVKDVI